LHGLVGFSATGSLRYLKIAMKASQFLISTLKEAPADAEIVSHKLMMRAGMIKRLGAGIYNYLPMGLRVIRKVEAVIRQEMDRAGAIELLMPVVQPAELWRETGRFDKMGPELLRVKDRHGRDFIIQPTSEEVITDIARQELRSYKQLPKNFYHIQTKFRDERRPRFGLMRGREFTMKDAYSFDRDSQSAAKSYDAMFSAYCRVFGRLGLAYRAVAADTGAIGGDQSHEFQVIAETGEDAIAYCPTSEYAANIELAEALAPQEPRAVASQALTLTMTPRASTCQDVAALLGVPLQKTVKSLVLATDESDGHGVVQATRIWLLLLRGDHELNEVKASKVDGLKAGFRFATLGEIESAFGCKPGYLGPVGLSGVTIVADRTVAAMSDFVCGANQVDHHYTGTNWGRDLPEPQLVADLRNVVVGDPSPDGEGSLAIQRGIEVGHVFYLGRKYSEAMGATFLAEDGKPRHFEMGCYGIGVTRLLGAAIEQGHDEKGIVWPISMAPFELVICPIGMERSEAVREHAHRLYAELQAAGVDVMLDDRGERPGAMFADWELVGIPLRVVLSERGIKEGMAELQGRRDDAASSVPLDGLLEQVKLRLRA
jgi:prolyl-tRNA synthetase